MEKIKWHGVVFALFILFLYVMGVYDIFMMLSFDEAYYASKGYGQSVVEYFTNYPLFGLVFWIGNLAFGLISPILYFLRKQSGYKIAFASFLCDLILVIWGVLFRNRLSVLGMNIFCFDMFILIITLAFSVYLWRSTPARRKKKDVYEHC